MDEEEKENILKLASDLQDLMNLLGILEGVAERLRKEVNAELEKLKKENGDDIGFESQDSP